MPMINGGLLASGGLGVFLLGMAVMTDGLKSLAHDRLRNLLRRSTHSALSGAVTGAITTALVQSSSATTVAAVGFVGAGLLTFSESLGIIYGANIGTTVTGWLVALFGFKVKLGVAAFPLILIGVLTHLFGKGRLQAAGFALAGFGLIFVGIGVLQEGMSAFSQIVTPQSFPSDTFAGRLLLVLLGVVITLVTQSSSAGVAMAITAVHAGNIALPQAAAMVIGMDIGTTATALMATIGGKIQARRTGLAHVIYNLLTGAGAFLLLPLYIWTLGQLAPNVRDSDPELALVAFHTLFNIIGVSTILPFTGKFASLIERLIPERGGSLTKRLDPQLEAYPDMAMAAVQMTCCDLTADIFRRLSSALRKASPGSETSLDDSIAALEETKQFLRNLRVLPKDEPLAPQRQGAFHILDHLRRLAIRLAEKERIQSVCELDELAGAIERLAATADAVADDPLGLTSETAQRYHDDYRALKDRERPFRQATITAAARGELDPDMVIVRTDAVRTLRRMGFHVWRIVFHLCEDFGQTKVS